MWNQAREDGYAPAGRSRRHQGIGKDINHSREEDSARPFGKQLDTQSVRHSVGLCKRERADDLERRLQMAWNAKPDLDFTTQHRANGVTWGEAGWSTGDRMEGPRGPNGGAQSPST